MVDKGEKLYQLAYTSLPELPWTTFSQALQMLFSHHFCGINPMCPPPAPSPRLVVGKEVSALENTLCFCCHQSFSWTNRAQRKKNFFFERKEGKKGGNVSWRLWWALQIGTLLSTAFHGFLESFQRRLCFVRDGFGFLLFKAIFESFRKLLFSFPDSYSMDTDVYFLWISSLLVWLGLHVSSPLSFRSPFCSWSCYLRGLSGMSLWAPTKVPSSFK